MVIEAMLECQKSWVVQPRDLIVSHQIEFAKSPPNRLFCAKRQKRDLLNARWIYYHRVLQGVAQRGAQFYFIFSGSPAPFFEQRNEPFLP